MPLLPAIGYAVNPKKVHVSEGLKHLYSINWLYCFLLSFSLYFVLSKLFPPKATIIPAMILGLPAEAADSVADEKDGKETDSTEVKAVDV